MKPAKLRAPGLLLLSAAWMLVAFPAGSQEPPPEKRIPSADKPECWVDIRVSPVVYPEQARKREETGAVVVEFDAREKWAAPRKPKVTVSSGFPRLDDEALRAAAKSRVRTNCPGVRFSHRTVFRIRE